MTGWETGAIVAGGLFTSGVLYFALMRVPRWRAMEIRSFLPDFARTINVADKVQPTLLLATIISVSMLARSIDGTSQVLAVTAITGFTLTLVGSLAFLVPLQRRMIRLGPEPSSRLVPMRARWIKGHLGRASLAAASFALLVLAVLSAG